MMVIIIDDLSLEFTGRDFVYVIPEVFTPSGFTHNRST
jgi:hypothetical protein